MQQVNLINIAKQFLFQSSIDFSALYTKLTYNKFQMALIVLSISVLLEEKVSILQLIFMGPVGLKY